MRPPPRTASPQRSSSSTERLEVGRIHRAHGIKGEVVVSLVTNRTERLAAGAELWADDELLQVGAARPNRDRWLVRFDGIADRTAALALAGRTLYAEPIDDPDELWVHELIGRLVVSPDGRSHGRVEAVEANPASDLLVLDSGSLVPLTFLVDADQPDRLVVDPPAGLFEEG